MVKLKYAVFSLWIEKLGVGDWTWILPVTVPEFENSDAFRGQKGNISKCLK